MATVPTLEEVRAASKATVAELRAEQVNGVGQPPAIETPQPRQRTTRNSGAITMIVADLVGREDVIPAQEVKAIARGHGIEDDDTWQRGIKRYGFRHHYLGKVGHVWCNPKQFSVHFDGPQGLVGRHACRWQDCTRYAIERTPKGKVRRKFSRGLCHRHYQNLVRLALAAGRSLDDYERDGAWPRKG